jgi:hypothetical protein
LIAVYTVLRRQGIADQPNKLSGESLTTNPHERMPLLVWVFSWSGKVCQILFSSRLKALLRC